jgi:hypothetical protein
VSRQKDYFSLVNQLKSAAQIHSEVCMRQGQVLLQNNNKDTPYLLILEYAPASAEFLVRLIGLINLNPTLRRFDKM